MHRECLAKKNLLKKKKNRTILYDKIFTSPFNFLFIIEYINFSSASYQTFILEFQFNKETSKILGFFYNKTNL